MLRKRSMVVGSKQGLMSDYSSISSPTAKYNRPTTSSLFLSPRPFTGGFAGKGFLDNEPVLSPTSILETKHFSAIGNPFSRDRNPKKPPVEAPPTFSSVNRHHPWENGESRAMGLSIVESLNDEKSGYRLSKPESRMVLSGSQLRIQIPPMFPSSVSPTGSAESPHSPLEFGIKTRNLLLGSLLRDLRSQTGLGNSEPKASSPQVFTGSFSMSEIELSEDYTCVITHGPNPKTTHIFDDYTVESCGDGYSALRKKNGFLPDQSKCPPACFLSFCHACKKGLGEGKDTFMYRGEKAFCSEECRHQEMMFDEGMGGCSCELANDT